MVDNQSDSLGGEYSVFLSTLIYNKRLGLKSYNYKTRQEYYHSRECSSITSYVLLLFGWGALLVLMWGLG